MVAKGEKYKAEDDANKNHIEAKNGLENYCYSQMNLKLAKAVKIWCLLWEYQTMMIGRRLDSRWGDIPKYASLPFIPKDV